MKQLRPYGGIILSVLALLILAGFNTVLYYGYGGHHSIVPALITGITLLIVFVLAGMAAYRIRRHEGDDTETRR